MIDIHGYFWFVWLFIYFSPSPSPENILHTYSNIIIIIWPSLLPESHQDLHNLLIIIGAVA